MVDVFSPSHVELAARFGILMSASTDRVAIHEMSLEFLETGIGPSSLGVVIMRAGEKGSFVYLAAHPARWLPVDPTGAGNVYEAACYGTIASTFLPEEIGIPALS